MQIFDVIIPTYNNKDELIDCLRGFNDQIFKKFRVLICVNGSIDGTIEAIKSLELNFEFQILEHNDKQNHGRPANRNLGLKHTNAEYVLMIDSDTVPHQNLLNEHYNLLSTVDCISVGNIIYAENNDWTNYLQSRGKGKFNDCKEMPFQYLNTQNMAVKSKYLIEINGLDENLTSYGGDDTELAYRINEKFNLKTINNTSAIAYGNLNKSIDLALSQMFEFGNTNLKYIYQKHPNFTEIFNLNLLKNKLFNTFIANILFFKISKILYPIFPIYIKNKLIHYMVFYKICKGFKMK